MGFEGDGRGELVGEGGSESFLDLEVESEVKIELKVLKRHRLVALLEDYRVKVIVV